MSEDDVEVTSLDLKAILQTARVPDPLTNLLDGAYESIEDFAYAFPTIEALDPWLRKLSAEVFQQLGNLDAESILFSQPAARLRMALRGGLGWAGLGWAHSRREDTLLAKTEEPARGVTPTPQQVSWMEHIPPKLTQDKIDALIDRFKKNYLGEILTQDTAPSIRLLSLVHEGMKSRLSWILWQYRLSVKQYQEIHEAKTQRPWRSEMQLLAHAFVDDTPEINLENKPLAGLVKPLPNGLPQRPGYVWGSTPGEPEAVRRQRRRLCPRLRAQRSSDSYHPRVSGRGPQTVTDHQRAPDPEVGLRTRSRPSATMFQASSNYELQRLGRLRTLGAPSTPGRMTLQAPAPRERAKATARASPRREDPLRPEWHQLASRLAGYLPRQADQSPLPDGISSKCKYLHVCAIKGCHQVHPAKEHPGSFSEREPAAPRSGGPAGAGGPRGWSSHQDVPAAHSP